MTLTRMGPRERAMIRSRLNEEASLIHMVGIGGVGMAGLARLLLTQGHSIHGSEKRMNTLTEWLAGLGAVIHAGHAQNYLSEATRLVIHTAAVKADNPEIQRAAALGIPIALRGEVLPVLAEAFSLIAVAGTHGKTTTTAMIAGLLRHAGLDPGWYIGGEPPTLGAVAAAGTSPWLVCECDESDGTLVHYQPRIALVTNLEFDHMETFSGEGEIIQCFERFARQAEILIACFEDRQARALAAHHPHAWSYGFAEGARVRAIHPEGGSEWISSPVTLDGKALGELRLTIGGRHNLLNALGALTVGLAIGLPAESLLSFFPAFASVKRRFEWIARSDRLAVVSDYAHHPTEIHAVIKVARQSGRRLVAAFQPHRYSRTRQLGREFPAAFEGVDYLVLLPVYAASEPIMEGGRSEDLLRFFREKPVVPCELATTLEDGWARLQRIWKPGDLFLILGAGDVEVIARWAADWAPTPS